MLFDTPLGSFKLERIPQTKKGDLRAWDAADELLIQTVFEKHSHLLNDDSADPILIINDAFGALSLALHKAHTDNWSDSYLSHLAIQHNLKLNQLNGHVRCIPSTDPLSKTYPLVLIKIPKTLALLEEQLCGLKPHLAADSIIIAAAMSRHIHTSTLKLFEQIIGSTTSSRAVKKARVIFAKNNQANRKLSSYPKIIQDSSLKLTLSNMANVFARDRLDIGTRFFIEQLPHCPPASNIIDLGCGNGALGIMIQRYQPQAKLHFVDESYMAIASAKKNYQKENPDKQANFTISNCLAQYADKKADLILCNPPFHQSHSIGDQIAWQMFKQSREILEGKGELWIIGNRHLGYHTKLKRLFGNARLIKANKKFVVLASTLSI